MQLFAADRHIINFHGDQGAVEVEIFRIAEIQAYLAGIPQLQVSGHGNIIVMLLVKRPLQFIAILGQADFPVEAGCRGGNISCLIHQQRISGCLGHLFPVSHQSARFGKKLW
ncbi:hypothetical protein D3C76_1370430 [compost metagenome]